MGALPSSADTCSAAHRNKTDHFGPMSKQIILAGGPEDISKRLRSFEEQLAGISVCHSIPHALPASHRRSLGACSSGWLSSAKRRFHRLIRFDEGRGLINYSNKVWERFWADRGMNHVLLTVSGYAELRN